MARTDAASVNPIHRIHLRGFWNVTSQPGVARTEHRRRFGRPRTIEPHEAVWIVFAEIPGNSSVWLNERELGPGRRGEVSSFEVTDQLLPRNELRICTDAPPTELLGEVVIEIRQRT